MLSFCVPEQRNNLWTGQSCNISAIDLDEDVPLLDPPMSSFIVEAGHHWTAGRGDDIDSKFSPSLYKCQEKKEWYRE